MPAVLGYALLLQCIVRVRHIEDRQVAGDHLSPRDILRLGCDPGDLRFQYGLIGARIAQVICLVFAISLVVLAFVSKDFFYGLVVIALLGGALYVFMLSFIESNADIFVDGNLHTEINDKTGVSSGEYSQSPFYYNAGDAGEFEDKYVGKRKPVTFLVGGGIAL